MAERWTGRASVRLRTTAAAVVVVAVALAIGALVLVALVRGSLRDGVEATAEQRAADLASQVERSGPPRSGRDPDGDGDDADDEGEDPDDPEDLVWQVLDDDGRVVSSSQPLFRALPADGEDEVRLPGADQPYLVVTEDADAGDASYDVVVAASLESVEESTDALVAPLAVGLPLVLLLVGGTTWVVAGRALAPVERIRREVEGISGDRLDRRVPEPPARDEVRRLAVTMNAMLTRLQASRDRQQQFVADASHELRSPLASIRQTAEVAREHPGALPEGELAEAVLEESVRMQRLVEQLLVLTRADEGALARTRVEVDLDDLALAEARRVRRAGLAVDASGVGPGRVQGDPLALAQVVRNLVDNAARHAASRLAVSVAERAGTVELAVEDDGPGVPEAERERVFERFVRLDDARARDAGGSGLGLAIVREAVAAHGGTVGVSTSALGGARFVVRLPAAAAEGAGGASTDVAGASRRT
ncbi:HAMP domain-containing protein [Nocardioides sp. zg-579]|uniref:histidine kinase n=1 Tax=Nocardioides marmotae TaxID=2663857 RepID=A0A6I3JAQ8_9ACTN|nr:ATP-binding protein [Nocardioides marmotae]MCR6031553.1 HAMP domain-containing protein [Gordonia jinghuaiqii]MTB95192.1 HAMP domain-containing protein [Nocardioides marmotae]QKE02325.1 HAMP domain-containing protein [Nocardioides marmotae]